jgi:lactoylglutathione lyase
MRDFYESVMAFPLVRTVGDRSVEHRVGSTALALTAHGACFSDPTARARRAMPTISSP